MSTALVKRETTSKEEKASKKKVSPFLQKLYNILQDENNNDIIRWNKEGNGFILVDYKRFVKELLSKNFKTEVFSSFIRQLNLYDFHKIKSKDSNNKLNNTNANTFYEFTNINFLKDQPERINLIKRKTKNENLEKKGQIQGGVQGNELVVHPLRKFINFKEDKTKLNLGKMYKKALKLKQIVGTLRKKVQILEGKYDFLEYCNKEFGENNINIVGKLQKILDKKHTLESFFTLLVQNFFPTIKLVDTSLPEPSEQNQIQPNNQISEKRNNEIISQLYKVFNLNDNNMGNNTNNIQNNNQNGIISNNNIVQNNKKNNNIINGINIINSNQEDKNIICNKNQINQLMEQMVDSEKESTETREINTYNKIIDFQKQYFKDLEEQNSKNYLNMSNDSQLIQENNSIKSLNSLNNDKDILNVSSNNNLLNLDKKNFLNKKTLRDSEGTLSDGSKDLL